jgi:hypothetical protein
MGLQATIKLNTILDTPDSELIEFCEKHNFEFIGIQRRTTLFLNSGELLSEVVFAVEESSHDNS